MVSKLDVAKEILKKHDFEVISYPTFLEAYKNKWLDEKEVWIRIELHCNREGKLTLGRIAEGIETELNILPLSYKDETENYRDEPLCYRFAEIN